MTVLLLGMAWAVCGDDLPAPTNPQPVVWISPLRKTVGANAGIRVVPMPALREAARKGPLSVGRLLQIVGERKKATNPRKPWKVTVFEASTGGLCRPIARADETDFVAGLPVCTASWSRSSKRDSGCGTTNDRKDGSRGVEVLRARWRDLAPQGFCVLPAERFVEELGR